MKLVEYSLTVFGPAVEQGRLSPSTAGGLLGLIEPAARASAEVGFRRSSAPGRRPAWLREAGHTRFVGAEGQGSDAMRMHFEAPRFRDVAAEPYEQGKLFDQPPEPTDTAFDLLADVLGDVEAKRADSVRFDPGVLRKLERFRRPVFESGVSEVVIGGGRIGSAERRFDARIVENAASLYRQTPASRRVRVTGKLDMIRDSDKVFTVILSTGDRLRGVWVGGDSGDLAEHFGQRVVFGGKAVFRPSKTVLRIDAEYLEPARDADEFFSVMPEPTGERLDIAELRQSQRARKGVPAVWGRWPGDETDEVISAALQELS